MLLEDVQIRDATDCQSPRRHDKSAALLGGVAAGAYVGGAGVATTAAQWGPRAAAGQAVAQRAAAQQSGQSESSTETNSENNESNSAPSYRRTEHDRGIY